MGPPSWQGLILIYLYLIIHFAGFLIMLSPNRPFASNSFIRPKTIAKVAILKTKSAIIAFFSFSFFSFPHSFFFSFPFPLLLWFWIFSGLRNVPFDAFSFKRLQISLGWYSKNRVDIHMYKHIYLQGSWKVDGIRQVQKPDRINLDRQSGSDQLGSTRTNSDRIKK